MQGAGCRGVGSRGVGNTAPLRSWRCLPPPGAVALPRRLPPAVTSQVSNSIRWIELGDRPEIELEDRPELGDRPEKELGDRPETELGDRPEIELGDRPEIELGAFSSKVNYAPR